MSKRKFILLSIMKTWLISTLVTVVLLIVFLSATREVREHPRNCDMSGLAYAFAIFWILFLSVLSLSSLLSVLRPFQGKIKTVLCWFLLPGVAIGSLFAIPDGKVSKDDILLFLIMNMPWLVIWTFYYFRMNSRFNRIDQ
ncbi:hypothetical protein [Chryseobacterium sp.]|uniref:hypothetical protein n=1 Tax=Chryseobacterium sp. TaxID=1871047 RepID=UPI0028983726|nr:hypothetical protein [Chryseobacterium sp.]